MELTVNIPFHVERMDCQECDSIGVPYGTIKILDGDGDLFGMANTLQDAKDKIHDHIMNAGFLTFEFSE